MERIFIEAYCDRERNEVIHELERKITDNGGWIMDHQMFSNKSISLWVVTDRVKLEKMFNDLKLIELNMNAERLNSILLAFQSNHDPENVILFLTINFINNYSNLKIKIPVGS
jgi:hypothetical protein